MAIEVPATPKVYTTKYDNFKGVDFTNDSTNVWRRRSPTGTNMLPDASGRPMKRNGWEVLLSNEDLCTALSVDSCTIWKCAYFELAGQDHIVIFTDSGVIFYNGEIVAVSKDKDIYPSYDRCFFFEGNGVSAFYIYGNFRVWKYYYEDEFILEEVTDKLYIPTVLIGTSADCVGTLYQGYNLLGNRASVEYHDADLFTYWGSDGLVFTVSEAFKTNKTAGSPSVYRWKRTNGSWVWDVEGETAKTFDSNITVSDPQEGNQITVIYAKGVLLPNNVSSAQADEVKLWGSLTTQFDTLFEPMSTAPTTNHFRVWSDGVDRKNKQAFIEFNASQTFADLGEEDIIKVEFPSTEVNQWTVVDPDTVYSGQAHLIGEEV